jgi:molybdate transport system regulatory protein
MKSISQPRHCIQPRFRILCDGEIAFGPGKAELLRHIEQTGSLREAAARMDISYMRAWTLIKTMNQCFCEPLVNLSRGGPLGGGAVLTEAGHRALALYSKIESASRRAAQASWMRLERMLTRKKARPAARQSRPPG